MKGRFFIHAYAFMLGNAFSAPSLDIYKGAAPNATNARRGEIPPNYTHERIGAQAKRKSGKRPKRK